MLRFIGGFPTKITSVYLSSSVLMLYFIHFNFFVPEVTNWYQEPAILGLSLPPSLNLSHSSCVGANPSKPCFDLFLERVGTSILRTLSRQPGCKAGPCVKSLMLFLV
jgi:hypothetical protein